MHTVLKAAMAALALSAASTALAQGSAPVASGSTPPTPSGWQGGALRYMCGGVALEARQALIAQAAPGDVRVEFAQGSGNYLADVTVSVQGRSSSPASFTAEGPVCLFRLPAGEYTVVAEYQGVQRTQKITGGKGGVFVLRWP